MASGTLSSKAILSRASNFSINDILGDSSKKGQNSEKSVAKDSLPKQEKAVQKPPQNPLPANEL